MRLRRSHLSSPGLRRLRRGKGFRYCSPSGAPVDAETLERIKALAIPPAWEDVWICPFPNGHIQATGVDAAGRRQYRYHDAWRIQRDAVKFDHMLEFARGLPELRARVAVDLHLPGLPKARVLALGVRLLDVGMFRIGGEEYAHDHETYGLATIEKRHLTIRDGQARFDYPAKGGIRRQITVADPLLVDLLKQLKRRRGGGASLLAWKEEGRWVNASSHDVNTYLKERSAGDFTAKDFRTWDATLLAAVLCAQAHPSSSPSSRKRCLAGIIREVAGSLGNTPAVCRKSYVDPRVLDRFDTGETIRAALEQLAPALDLTDARLLAPIELAVISLLAERSERGVAAA